MHDDIQVYPYNRRYSLRRRRKPFKIAFGGIKGLADRRVLIESGVILAVAFGLSRAMLLNEVLPFGTAFFTAAVGYRKGLIWPMAAVICVGLATTVQGFALWQAITIIVLIGSLFQIAKFRDSLKTIYLPTVSLVATVLVKGIFTLVWAPAFYNLLLVSFEGFMAAGLTFVFLIVFGALMRFTVDDTSLSNEEAVCIAVLAAGALAGIHNFEVGSLKLTGILSGFIILSSAYVGGSGMGAGVGALVGIIPSLATAVSPAAVGLYSFSGLTAGLFRHMGKLGVIVGFIIGHLLLAVYLLGQGTIMLVVGEMFLALSFFVACPDKWYEIIKKVMPATETASQRESSEAVLQRVQDLGQVFHELGRTFDQTGATREMSGGSDIDSIDLMLGTITSNVCRKCSVFSTCWESDVYRTYQDIVDLFVKIESLGNINEKDLGSVLLRRCRRTKELVATINCLWDICQVNSYWQKKLRESRGLVASQLHGVADIVSGLVQQTQMRENREEEVEERLIEIMECNGLDIKDATVYRRNNNYQCQLVKSACHGSRECQQKVLGIAQDVLGCRMSMGRCECGLETGKGTCSIGLVPKRILDIEVGIAREVKDGSVVSGDSYALTYLNSGKVALVLSDGMGTGTRAAKESSATVTLLKQLLETGFDHDLAVRTVNATLALRSPDDTFSTVDLALIDLFSGETEFVKIAAAPTFIRKNGKFKSINSNSLPIGILDTVDFEPTVYQLEYGDMFVMMTDGVLDAVRSESRESWVLRELEKVATEDPQRIAGHLAMKAKEASKGKLKDDLSVIAVRLTPFSLH